MLYFLSRTCGLVKILRSSLFLYSVHIWTALYVHFVECVENVFRRLSQDVTESEIKILTKKHKIKGQPAMTAYQYLTALFHQRENQPQGLDLRMFLIRLLHL